jgi:hypothetical protein
MRKSNTFDAGTANPFGARLLVHLQPSVKPWGAGDFTVNLVVTQDVTGDPPPFAASAETFWQGRDGSYRIGNLLYGRDKWWALTDSGNVHGLSWRASSYRSQDRVFAEASEDVIKDLVTAFGRLRHHLM